MTVDSTIATPILKDPQADLDYAILWTGWLDGDTIVTSTWTVDAIGVTLHNDSIADGTTTTVWMSGGLVGPVVYGLTNHIVTAAGRADDRTLHFRVEQR